jgi:hypothetical protein
LKKNLITPAVTIEMLEVSESQWEFDETQPNPEYDQLVMEGHKCRQLMDKDLVSLLHQWYTAKYGSLALSNQTVPQVFDMSVSSILQSLESCVHQLFSKPIRG